MIPVIVEQTGRAWHAKDPAGRAHWRVSIFSYEADKATLLFTAELRTEAMSLCVAKEAHKLCDGLRVFVRSPTGDCREVLA